MKFDKKERFRHEARKNTTEGESDLDDKFHIIEILRTEFGISGLSDEVIEIPPGGYTTYRRPDLLIRPDTVIELDGEGVHGFGDEVSMIEKDKCKDFDLKRAGYQIIRINSAITKGYDRDLVILELENHGFMRKKD